MWLGDSKRNIQGCPKRTQKLLGHELQQFGGMPKDARPFKESARVFLSLCCDTPPMLRVITAVQLGRRIYVLHGFQKKSKRSIATPQRDVDLIRRPYAEAQELAREYEKTKIN
jgi:phage-related protein